MNSETHFCLRVDVDTFEGLKKGIPEIYNLIQDSDIPLTVYLSLGNYATGRNIFRKIKHKEKLTSIPLWERNSLRSLFRGVLLPPAKIGKSAKGLLKNYESKDLVEIHPHGYNHVKWSTNFHEFSREKTNEYIENIFTEYENIFHSKPIANAAPNFQTNKIYFQIMKEKGVEFLADFKHPEPFFLQFETPEKNVQEILQLPVTEPTIEELIIQGKNIERIKEEYRTRFKHYKDINSNYICFYLHAIYEPFKMKKLLEYILNLTIKFDMKPTSHKNFKEKIVTAPKIRYDEIIQR
ncbi:MAG: putative 4-deoxy-4-formamido-L-arabinose-phosphoundecaprenol deformylase ArnD [Candidatus Heimdallarchaeota archaeon AB_125]|nr:MAG: putative 4-deoxy-4-formamido-L-arabinose-phosphoundecaprenol deformylase ArnD [Candidatus Heimdallarchaeota archaeon AB_125]